MQAQPPVVMPGEFFYGNMRQFNRDTLHFMYESRNYGDFVKFFFGPFPVYIANHPDVAHEVFVTKADHFYKSRVTKQVMKSTVGDGLFTNDGDSWKRQRKLAQPAFHTKRIAAYADVMTQYASQLIAGWRDNAPLDMEREMTALTMQIVGKTLFDAAISEEDATGTAVRTVLRAIDKRFSQLIPTPEWLPLRENRDMKAAQKHLDSVIQTFIQERRQTGEDRGDLLSMLLLAQDENHGGMSDQQLRDEVMTIFGAGHETTSGALTWALYLLSQHPEVAAQLHAEIDSVLGDRLPTYADLARLPWTDMIIKEAMRLYPPAWGVTREVIAPVSIHNYPLRQGVTVFINIIGIHHDERFYENPNEFIPERFSPDNEKNIPKYAYLPFGAGPRVCIGNSFAMMEARLLLATIAQKFTLSLAPEQVVVPERVFTLRPKFGMKMVAHVRQAALHMA
jgi:cytochrome P450